MAIVINQSDTFEEWRVKCNTIASVDYTASIIDDAIANNSYTPSQVGAMVSGNTEHGISVTYDSINKKLDFDVNDPTITLTGDVTGSATMSNLGSISIDTTVAANRVALGTDTTGNYVKIGSTSGSGISGSVNSEGGTFTVSSNATASSNANTIVYRDASSNFAANDISVNNITASGDITANGGDMYATNFHGNATTANYADLAENYVADDKYAPGTVLSIGGNYEVTQSNTPNDTRIIGVVSTNPGFLMNKDQEGESVVEVALTGRVPCKVNGIIKKGDMLVSDGFGRAIANNDPKMGSVIGKALEDSEGNNTIEVVVGKL